MIGILGGTFDPVHYGHLRPALEVMQSLALDEVRFIPNHVPPHREIPWLNTTTRKRLLDLALSDMPGFVLDDRELQRAGPSYMIDTLASLRSEFPETSLCLVIGMDAFAGLPGWHRWQEILNLCHIVVTTRPGFNWPETPALAALEKQRVESAEILRTAKAGHILLQCVTMLDISSSYIRQQIQQGESVRFLLPDAVNDYIAQHCYEDKLNT